MARSLVVVVAAVAAVAVVGPLDVTVVGRSPVEVGSFAEEPRSVLDWTDVAAAVGVGVVVAAAAATVVDPDLLSPVVGRERKSIVPDVANREKMPAISVSHWLHGLWGEAIRSVDAVEVGQVSTVLAGSAAVVGD